MQKHTYHMPQIQDNMSHTFRLHYYINVVWQMTTRHLDFLLYWHWSSNPLSCSRQLLSNNNYLEDKRDYYCNCSILYCTVYYKCGQWYAHCTHICEQFIQFTVGLGFVVPMTHRIPCNLMDRADQEIDLSNLSEPRSRALMLVIPSRTWVTRCSGLSHDLWLWHTLLPGPQVGSTTGDMYG